MNNIKELYERVIDKKSFVSIVANEVNRSETSIYTNWFSTGSIPDEFKNRVHELLINTLKCQANETRNMTK